MLASCEDLKLKLEDCISQHESGLLAPRGEGAEDLCEEMVVNLRKCEALLDFMRMFARVVAEVGQEPFPIVDGVAGAGAIEPYFSPPWGGLFVHFLIDY